MEEDTWKSRNNTSSIPPKEYFLNRRWLKAKVDHLPLLGRCHLVHTHLRSSTVRPRFTLIEVLVSVNLHRDGKQEQMKGWIMSSVATIPEASLMGTTHVGASRLFASQPSSFTPIVFVVDDDVYFRESVEQLVRREGWQAQSFASAREFLAQPCELVPSCLILSAAPGTNSLEVQKQILRERGDVPIIVNSGSGDALSIVQAIKAGAVDFLVKPFSNSALLSAIRESIQRSRMALEHEIKLRDLRNRYLSLTPRERQVMKLVVSGLLNKQVGGELGISIITVKAHRGKMMRKMKATSLADLVRMASKLRPDSPAIHLA